VDSDNPTIRIDAPEATVCDQESIETAPAPLLSFVLTLSNVIGVVAPTVGVTVKIKPITATTRTQRPK